MNNLSIKLDGHNNINPATLMAEIDAFYNALPEETKREIAIEGLETRITEALLRDLRNKVAEPVGDMTEEDRKKHFSIISNMALSLNTSRDVCFSSDL
ncbi:hypothetical protein [Shinella zoogloeoides]|uniref:Uncharacterized protein n=1 Tax=Shinella zoogloeoides TaxID=352475 RepID=A0A6N8TJB5_SHIZO|nr:hypothetical protein [Shinella zoogloeoides]MXO02326.1 hypothetical protein [Shinella zoogloeoides]UEX81980.1 hypothetical protein K8M09_01360 [Shinella zoogloeoides]